MSSYSLDQCLFLAYQDAFRQNRTHPILLASEKAYSTTECEDKCRTRQTFPPKITYHNHVWNNAKYICTHFCPFVCIIESYVHYILSMFDKWGYISLYYIHEYIYRLTDQFRRVYPYMIWAESSITLFCVKAVQATEHQPYRHYLCPITGWQQKIYQRSALLYGEEPPVAVGFFPTEDQWYGKCFRVLA